MENIMKNLILLVALCLTLCLAADARLPAVGDYVRISYNVGPSPSISYEGNITGISDGLICLICSQMIVMNANGEGYNPEGVTCPFDVCIGTGQISMMVWLN
jgi:hypothetical protein